MKRRLLNGLAGLSLILALATGGLWGRSYWVYDQLWHAGDGGRGGAGIASCRGRMVMQSLTQNSPWAKAWNWELSSGTAVPSYAKSLPWFDYLDQSSKTERFISVIFPHWSLLLALSILPALRGWQLLRAQKRQSENLCPQCGYDLRATPQRCPECGAEARDTIHA